MADAEISRTDDGARRTALKRAVVRLGVPVALLAISAGAAPASADTPPACTGLVAAYVAGAERAPLPVTCNIDSTGIYPWVKIEV